MNGIQLKFFWLPMEVIYYVLIPMFVILLVYLIFALVYKKKKGTYYYNYVVDYVYSTLGIIFCGLLFCLLFGYSIATIQLLIVNKIISRYILFVIILVILPIVPSFFLVYVIRVYIKNLKRKSRLDNDLENKEKEHLEYVKEKEKQKNNKNYDEIELVKKNG